MAVIALSQHPSTRLINTRNGLHSTDALFADKRITVAQKVALCKR